MKIHPAALKHGVSAEDAERAASGVHRTTLDNLIKRLELTREAPDAIPQSVKDEIVMSYRAGETLAVIGRRHGFSQNKVQRLLVAASSRTTGFIAEH